MSKAPPPPYPPPTEVPTLGYPSPPPAKPKPTSETTDENGLPEIDREQFLRWLATHPAPDDERLSAITLRSMIRDFQLHARRLLGSDAKDLANG